MAFNFLNGTRVSAIAMATGILVSGCGGGSTDAATTTVAANTNTNTNTDTASTSAVVNSASSTTQAVTGALVDPGIVQVAQPTADDSSSAVPVMVADMSSIAAASGTVATPAVIVASPTKGGGAPIAGSATEAKRSAVALNLTGLSYFSPELPTIDVMKRAGVWLTQCSTCTGLTSGASTWDTKEEAALNIDANGWVKSLPASSDTTHKYRSVSTMLSANGALPLGRYIVRYDGSGTITYGGFTKTSSSTAGRDVIDLISTGGAWLTIASTDPTNYVRNIRIYMPGGACGNDLTVYAASSSVCNSSTGAYVPFESFPATQIWHPQFLQDIKGFRALRFMDWSLTNAVAATTWADRTLPGARIWTAATGVPLESMLDLATMVGADAWVNVPPYANDDYATQLGTLAAAHLKGVSKLDLEYSNETWNYAFPVASWIVNQAKAKWPQQVAQGISPYTLADSWYGERLSQICRAAKAGTAQIRCVLNGQAANSWNTNQVLSCPYAAAELGHKCASDIDVVAIAPYFGGYISSPKLRSVVATWYADADGGLSKLFEEITGNDANGNAIVAPLIALGSGAPTGALTQSKGWMVATKAVADSYGLPMWAYEGGQHLVVPSGDADKGIQNLFAVANRDPRMGSAYDRMMSDWKSSNGQTFAYYSHVAPASVYGTWGLKESMSDADNPKWVSALKNRNALTCNWSGC